LAIYSNKGNTPKDVSGDDIRSTIITPTGVERVHNYKDSSGKNRKKSYRLNKIKKVLETAGPARTSYVEFDPRRAKKNTPVSVLVSFNQPIQVTGSPTLAVANTAAGASGLVATANSSVYYAGNTLNFKFTPTVAGTYKIAPQTIGGTNTIKYTKFDGSNPSANTSIPTGVVFGNLVVTD